ncbi:site-specific integrase [Lacibacter sp. MH-610]|uniref:site-specific integrase n=1 Tax=Lacibacter sp. MH-610 TaxID=3020883 RepID=UPI00389157BB
MHLSFQVKSSKKNEFGKAPIYARITINEVRTEFSLKRFIEPDKWINKAGVAKGNTEEIRGLNAHIMAVRTSLFQHYNRLLETGKTITADTVKNSYFGITEKSKTIMEVFQYHNSQMKSLIGKEYSFGTHERYATALNHTKEFIEYKYNVSDYPIKQVNHEFITEYEYFLKAVRKCSHNTAIKYLTNFKKIMRICLGNGWIDKDPFINYRFRLNEVEREILHEHEIQAIADKEFATSRLEQVRDVFLFCCFTGLAYSDVKKLTRDHVIIGIDGERWIKVNRTKTDTRSSIPILPSAQAILDKYASHPKCCAEKKLLPVNSNQKMNDYLKEIAAVCEIEKNITFHIARHSFATTVTLQNDVPIESVSKMLGHKSIRTTQHYAKVLDKKVSNDMALLKEKMNLVNSTVKIKIA